ncbi:hypothetical protein JG687_00010051 [Phytophthora cactorum]|uniref:Uncharacterized protein n=1 Tax=Phytophthora cactorum TaxID=29920 RepID=A0A8T1UDC8_9STRA|nr:hypothetical protein GQ600_5312 [Phytophthora cactorum]KAG6957327.1 hypothetical protein JG687_00010051 [Phytophthora cactorum]
MNKRYTIDIVDCVVLILYRATDDVVSFARYRRKWTCVVQRFAARHGYHGVAGAVGGSLLAIDRPEQYEIFYCGMGYPALSMQAIV